MTGMIDRAARAMAKHQFEMRGRDETQWDDDEFEFYWDELGAAYKSMARVALPAAFDTTDDDLFEGMETVVAAALREDVDTPGLAVSRAVFGFIKERSQTATMVHFAPPNQDMVGGVEPTISPETLQQAADALSAWLEDHILEASEMWPTLSRPSRADLEAISLDLLQIGLDPSRCTQR